MRANELVYAFDSINYQKHFDGLRMNSRIKKRCTLLFVMGR